MNYLSLGCGIGALAGAIFGLVLGLMIGVALTRYTDHHRNALDDPGGYRMVANGLCATMLLCFVLLSSFIGWGYGGSLNSGFFVVAVLLAAGAAFFGTNRVVTKVLSSAQPNRAVPVSLQPGSTGYAYAYASQDEAWRQGGIAPVAQRSMEMNAQQPDSIEGRLARVEWQVANLRKEFRDLRKVVAILSPTYAALIAAEAPEPTASPAVAQPETESPQARPIPYYVPAQPAAQEPTIPLAAYEAAPWMPLASLAGEAPTQAAAPSLEQEYSSAQAVIAGGHEVAETRAESPVYQVPAPAAPPRAAHINWDFLTKSEFWLNKVGIGLLLLGVAFFFKYSIDKGWLNEQVRVGLGLALGSVLLGFGLVLHKKRRHFSQVLLGGAIATYYITGYAAYQLLSIVPYEWAFGFMALVTALAFGLAVNRDEVILSLIAVAGGLLTPFVLTASSASVTGLLVYSCVVLAGASSIYLYKGWRSLLWIAYAGMWAVFLLAYFGAPRPLSFEDSWALQGASIFALLAFWAVPVLREALRERDPDRWPQPGAGRLVAVLTGGNDPAPLVGTHVYLLTVAVPLLALGFSRLVWSAGTYEVSTPAWGWITLGVAALYVLAAPALWRAGTGRWPGVGQSDPHVAWHLPYAHALMAILLFTLSVVQILEGDALIFSLAIEAVALHFVSWRLSNRGTAVYAHLISLGVAGWLVLRWVGALAGWPGEVVENILPSNALAPASWTDVAVAALLALSSFSLLGKYGVALYRNFVHFEVVALLYILFQNETGWSWMVMLAWAAYAIVLNACRWIFPTRFSRADTTIPASAVLILSGLLFAWRIVAGHVGELAVFNLNTLYDFALPVMAAGASFLIRERPVAAGYRITAYLGVTALLGRELYALPYGESYVMLAWAACGLLMHALATRISDRGEGGATSRAAALPVLGAAVWFTMALPATLTGTPVFNPHALMALASMGLVWVASLIATPRRLVKAYWLGIYVAALGWLWHEFQALENGEGLVILLCAALAVAVYVLSTRYLDRKENIDLALVSQVTLVVAAVKLAQRLVTQEAAETPILNPAALTDLGVIVMLAISGVIAGFIAREHRVMWAFLGAAHLAVLAWFWREFSPLESGNAFISIAWGAYAIALLVVGLQGKRALQLVYGGLATLLLVVAKLFIVDLSAVDPLWRVLLFLGFGGVFLLVSYFFQVSTTGKPGIGSGPEKHHGFKFRWPGKPA
jgi:uncharacterized membrane protein